MTSRRLQKGLLGLAAAASATAFSLAALAVPQSGKGFGLPVDVSAEGHRIDWLIGVTNVLTGILFVIMTGWLVWAGFKHNKDHPAKYDHGTSRRSIMIALSMAGSVFVIVDGNLFVNSTMDLENVYHNWEKIEKDPNTVRIEINAHQWAWDARYAGPDGKFNTKDDIVTLNDIRIPEGVPVVFEVSSTDVIHSFTFPNMRSKVDAVPGQINRMWVQAKQTGEFDIVCAQHCGTNHYKMKGQLTILSKEEYAKWAAQASKVSERAWDDNDAAAHWGWEWKGH